VKEEKEELTSEPLLEEIARVNRERKAVKSDDAEVPEYLWEEHGGIGTKGPALSTGAGPNFIKK
jgi:hypothetical protein